MKPDFLRHEALQDLERANPGACVMLVFAGLWMACDRFGRFEWKPRTLKLDILPFLPFDMAETLVLLERAGQIRRYVVDGKEYGVIDTFGKHQRITGKEAVAPSKFPAPPNEFTAGIDGETPGTHPDAQEGNEEGKEEEEGNGEPDPDDSPHDPLPTMAGAVCITLRAKGIPLVNPSHPDLLALLGRGVEIGSFVAAADKAVSMGKASFAYVLGIVKGQAADSQRMAANARASPPARTMTSAEQRALQAVPSIAAPHLRPQPPVMEFVEEIGHEPPLALG